MEQKNAWIYCRIDAPEDTHNVLKSQYEQLERYAEQLGFAIVGSSQDMGSSAQTISTGLQTAIDAAKAGAYSILLIANIACLGRERAGVEPILYAFRYHGVQVYSPLEGNVSTQKGACR